MRTRSILLLGILLLLPTAVARGDVLVLEGNEVPLTGEILSEDEETVLFRIRGLGEGTWLEIDRARVRACWRDEGTVTPARPSRPVPAAPRPDPAPPAVRTEPDRLDLALTRIAFVVPRDPGLKVLLWLAAYGALTLLIALGGHLAGLEKMRLGRAAILALITELLVLLGVMAARAVPEPMTFPLLFAALGTAWVLTARIVTKAEGSKAVLLLGFTVSTVLLVAGSLFSVLTVV